MKSLLKIMRDLYYYTQIEAVVWISALIYFATIDPYSSTHLNFCVFSQMGIDFCPGCGIGRSISMILHGDFSGSFHTHVLALPALAILVYRIFSLLTGKKITLLKHKEVCNG